MRAMLGSRRGVPTLARELTGRRNRGAAGHLRQHRLLPIGCIEATRGSSHSKILPGGGAVRALAASSQAPAEESHAGSALGASAKRLRDAFLSQEASAEIATEADEPIDTAAVLERIGRELEAGEGDLEVSLLGEPLTSEGRRHLVAQTLTGPSGGPSVRKIGMVLPTVEDIKRLINTNREAGKDKHEEKVRVEKPADLADMLEKFLKEKYYGKRTDHVALLAAWGPKVLGDAEGEFGEVGALMAMQLRAYRAGLESAKVDSQFEIYRAGDGKDCLVMPPSNFALLGLKDAFVMLLQGFRVLLVVQPRFLPQFLEVQKDMADCGLPTGLLEVLPGITPEADPEVLHEVLRLVDRLQFTGSSAMYKALVKKAYELGNLKLEHAGEVSGLNKVSLHGVSASHPAVAAGATWAAVANNGELCTSASVVEFDAEVGDTAESLKAALEAHSFKFGRDPCDSSLDVLLKDGKTSELEVKTAPGPEGLKEWWEKTVLAVPRGGGPTVSTNQSLGHCIFAPTIERAVTAGVQEDASCIYCVGVPEDKSATSARAGTTGCKLPESVFGGMKGYTYAVAGDHDGVGSVQTLLSTVKRRGPSWRDQEEAYAQYELTENAEMLIEFLSPIDQANFAKQVANLLEVFEVFMPQVGKPYSGQALVNGEGRSQLVTMTALRPSRKQLLIPRGVSLPEDIIKMALLCEMSPLKELPVDLHLISKQQAGKLRVTDPLKSFLRVVEKRLGWKVHSHDDYDELAAAMRVAEYPPYFYCVKDRHLLPLEFHMAIAEQGGYLYEGFPGDALTLFRWLTATQAWTVACTESQVPEADEALKKAWQTVGLREEPHEPPEIVRPKPRQDIGGGFGDMGLAPEDDKDWGELSDDSSSSSDDEDDAKATTAAEPKAGAEATAAAAESSSKPAA